MEERFSPKEQAEGSNPFTNIYIRVAQRKEHLVPNQKVASSNLVTDICLRSSMDKSTTLRTSVSCRFESCRRYFWVRGVMDAWWSPKPQIPDRDRTDLLWQRDRVDYGARLLSGLAFSPREFESPRCRYGK